MAKTTKMPPTRSDRMSDIYLYDIPMMERHNLCQLLLKRNVWRELATQMGYGRHEIDEISKVSFQTNDMEADELLTRWGEQNHTITELFVLLGRIHQYGAMNVIKNLVDSRFHKLIGKSQMTDSINLNDRAKSSSISKRISNDSEKILNAPMVSDDNNVSEHHRDDDKKHSYGDKFDVNECASAILKINYEELRDATNNWSDKNMLGKGGFATVFKGTWVSMSVAIKRIENRSTTATADYSPIQIKQSLNEMKHLNSCRHDNILSLYGVSVNGAEPCLVYQLMPGGSLEQKLFNRPTNVPSLTWQERINIAGGVARGLKFLHTVHKLPLIHSDIKPGNILLDTCNHPRIGDFGLVRQVEKDETVVSKAFGTRPYLPAEFLVHKILTTKVDIFSFGIVLFELATGLRAYDSRTKSHLILTIRRHGNLLDLIDKTADDSDEKKKIFRAIIDLGMECTEDKYQIRPDMSEVLEYFGKHLKFLPL